MSNAALLEMLYYLTGISPEHLRVYVAPRRLRVVVRREAADEGVRLWRAQKNLESYLLNRYQVEVMWEK